MTTLFSSKGKGIALGSQLGCGGEGVVFAVSHDPGLVAKVYHKPLDSLKQAKLSFMLATGDARLRTYVSWPTETLHSRADGPVVGFLMPKVAGRDPIHAIYSPAHRRKERPNAAWDFLIFAARNTASAFDSVHQHGHVIGDVNQDSLFVGMDSKVILIDSDSFQINAPGQVYQCQVGVAMFTPPELQSISSFSTVTRTPNHDNFGLALLIFQLLFGGRHPFSGVPLMKGVAETLEGDIKALRYAYANDATSRGIAPPPRPIPISLVPTQMQAMFHAAFTELGAQGRRPTAAQWVAVLDSLRGSTRKCAASKMHIVPGHLSKCPWCELEQQGLVYFVDFETPYVAPPGANFDINGLWARVEAVKMPDAIVPPTPVAGSFKPAPLPPGVSSSNWGTVLSRVLIVVVGMGFMLVVPKAWFVVILFAWGAWAMSGGENQSLLEERKKRQYSLDCGRASFKSAIDAVENGFGPAGFKVKRQALLKLRDEYLTLDRDERSDMDHLNATASTRQKAKFLEGFFIDKADISGIGPGRKATLRSFGIETAADVNWAKVSMVRGFGDSLTRALVDWRTGIERRFVFNPLRSVSEQEKAAVRAKFSNRCNELVAKLNAGPPELQQYVREASVRLSSHQSALLRSAQLVGQSMADMTAVS